MKGRIAKSSRLGGGEFQYARGFNAARQEPGLTENGPRKERLEKEALFCLAVFEAEPEAQTSLKEISDSLPNAVGASGIPSVPEKAISDWCSRWNLSAGWCREAAEQFVLQWWLEAQPGGEQFSSEELRKRSSAQERTTQLLQDPLKIDFGFWPVTQQTRKEFEEQCRDRLKQELKAFCDSVEKQAVAADMVRTPEKRAFDHFYWLARRVVHGESAADMKQSTASLNDVSIRAINKAVNALARDLQLTLGRQRENPVCQRVALGADAQNRRKTR
jgi:hypothetical protein